MKQYFIHDGQNEKGPFDFEQLKTLSLKKDTAIWYEGLDSWTTAGEIEELKVLFLAKSTPPPLNKNVEPIVPLYTRIETPTNTIAIGNDILPSNKKSGKTPLMVAGILLITSLVGWLIFQNQTQAETITEVQEQVIQQDQQITQQQQQEQQKEQQRILDEQQAQTNKDKINAANTQKFMGYRNNWSNYFIATSNQYTYIAAGGISDLAVIVYNQSDRIVDEIQVRVDYIKTNGGTFKSEIVSVTNIAANSEKTVSAPSSERGTSVKMEIISIYAKSIHFCYPSGMSGNQNFDPYFCK